MRAHGALNNAAAAFLAAFSATAAAAPTKPAVAPPPSTDPAKPTPGADMPAPSDTSPEPAPSSAPSQPPAIPTPERRDDRPAASPGSRQPTVGHAKNAGRALLDVEPQEDVDSDQAPEVRHARDTLGSHFVIAGEIGFTFPGGSFDQTTYQSDLLGPGLLVGGDIGYGVSHTVALGAYGELGLPSGEACASCSGSSFAVGPFVRYHLVQGVRFDPWLSAGAGFRKTTLGSSAWAGVDVIRVALGGDFYAWPSLGFGPFAEAAIGTYFDATPKLVTHSVDAHFALGLRVVFDSPGK